ncbi:MAG: hypothetical protein AB7H80_00450 [Candidatus Kapaibacterium sp.]
MKKLQIICLFLFVLSFTVTPSVSEAQSTEHSKSITLSPFHLVLPVLELTGEFQMQPKVGVAGILGFGSVSGTGVFEAGGQFNYYLIGDFDHGMQLGSELLYVHASDAVDNVSVAANGVSVAGYIGYKIAATFGLTFNAQLGGNLLLVRATAEDESSTATASGSDAGLLLNLNVGWSF